MAPTRKIRKKIARPTQHSDGNWLLTPFAGLRKDGGQEIGGPE